MKKLLSLFTITLILVTTGLVSSAQNIYTFAGQAGTNGYSGDGGFATAAILSGPSGIAADTSGNVYFADARNSVIRKVSPSGVITTFAGIGVAGYSGDGGSAIAAQLSRPSGVAVDRTGNVYISDGGNNVIRKVDITGNINTIAGNNTAGYSGDGGSALAAQLRGPNGIAVDTMGKIYFSDSRNNVIRMIDAAGIITTIGGNNTAGYSGDGGAATAAQISRPLGLTRTANGNIYFADARNHAIRMINASGIISTFAGNGTAGYSGDGGPASAALIHYPSDVKADMLGNIYFSDSSNTVRVIGTNDTIHTFAGSGVIGYYGDGGLATLAKMNTPSGIAIDHSHNVYICELGNNVIRRVGLPVPGINITSNLGDTICFGSFIHFTATAIADSTPHYQWLVNGVASGTDSFGFTPSGLVTGAVVSCELLDSAGGTVRAISNQLTLDSLPRAGVIMVPPTFCVGSVANIMHVGPGLPGSIWAITNSTIATLTTTPPPARITALAVGVDTLFYIQTNVCGRDTAMQPFTINLNNLGAITGPKIVCTGSTATYSDTSFGGRWRSRPFPAGTIDSLTGLFTAGFLPGPAYITYGMPGCTITDTITVYNLGPIMGPPAVCVNSATPFMDTSIGGIWSVSTTAYGTIDSVAGLFTANGTMGTTNITYSLSSACSVTNPVNVIKPAIIQGPTAVCIGNSTTFTDSAMMGIWSVAPPTMGTIDSITGAFTPSGTIGTAVINYSLIPGCSASDTVNIDSIPAIGPITGPWQVDSIWSVTLSDSVAGGKWTSINPSIATVDSTTGVVTGVNPGITTIEYTTKNAGGCSNTVTFNIAVLNSAGVANITNNSSFSLFPNPATQDLTIACGNQHFGIGAVTIADVTGKTIFSSAIDFNNSRTNTIDISSISNGIYVISIQSETGIYHGKLEVLR